MTSFAHVGQRLPDFLIIGAQKAGTRWLLNNLRKHPQLGLPEHELHFFDKAVNYSKGQGWYAEQFDSYSNCELIGEKTPDYLWYSKEDLVHHQGRIPSKIHQLLPKVKLVCLLRNPVERAISAINHLLREGYMNSGQLGNVFQNHALINQHGVLDIGLYHLHIKAFLRHFAKDQFYIGTYEHDIRDNPLKGVNQILTFLEVELMTSEMLDTTPLNISRVNVGHKRVYRLGGRTLLDRRVKWQPSPDDRKNLQDFYRPHNEQLFNLLGYEIDEWKV